MSPVTWLVRLVCAPAGAEAGTCTGTLKVQDVPDAKAPPVRVRRPAPEIWEPVPQTSFIGRPVATRPASAASRSSVNVIAVALDAPSRLVIVNSSVAGSPGFTGSSVKDLLIDRLCPEKTSRSSIAAGPVTGNPPMSPVTWLVRLVCAPAGAAAGTCTGTLKVHDPPAGSVPPVRVRKLVPEICEPTPQTSFIGVPVAANPLRAASRSSENVIAVALCTASRLAIVNSRVAEAPGLTGSSVNDFVIARRSEKTTSTSAAFGKGVVVDSIVAENKVVVFG